jgi:hypothetical protein
MVAPDEAGLLERAHPPQTGRRRYAGALRQGHIGHSSFVLQFAQNLEVDLVQLDAAHGWPWAVRFVTVRW